MKRLSFVAILGLCACLTAGQSRLPSYPGYDRYSTMPAKLQSAAKIVRTNVTWNADGKAFFFTRDGKRFKFEIATLREAESSEEAKPAVEPRSGGRRFGRGQQPSEEDSPNGQWTLQYRNRNLVLKAKSGGAETQVTADGSDANRVKYGRLTWTYIEELDEHTPFAWSPDSGKIAFYRFDESKVPDYFLTTNAAGFTNGILVEPYPKAGADNPVVDLQIYDVATKKTTAVDLRDGKPFDNAVVGHYFYDMAWSPTGKELWFLRSNRKQNIVEWCAAEPSTGKVRVIVREENPNGWADIKPTRRFLSDGNRFFWMSERSGYRNIYLYDLTGRLHNAVTSNPFEVESIVKVDEAKQTLWYLARGGDTPHKLQMYRVRFDGKDNRCLTDRKFSHAVQISPTGEHFVDVAETATDAPTTRLVDGAGKVLATLSRSDLAEYAKLGGRPSERIVFRSADGKHELYGKLSFPSNFDPAKKWPVLVGVYNGPQSVGFEERFSLPAGMAELGFLLLTVESRGGDNRGRAFKDAAYRNLGIVEIDDIAAGVRHAGSLPFVDSKRVGVYGTSYGGYSSILCLLRYPELFQAACASSSVTDWRHYDTTYTERYMWIPQENQAGYDAGSAMTYAKDLKGRLLLYYGTIDDNVHPANTMQLIRALQRAGKSFEVQVTPDAGHSGVSFPRMLEFFVESLVLWPAAGR